MNVYNGLDMRVSRVGLHSTYFGYLCDGEAPASPVLSDGYNIYTQGVSQTAISGGATSYYVLDRLGSSTRMMSSAQSVTDTQVLDAFGNSLSRTGSTWPMPFGFVAKLGYQTDEDSGLMLLGHRFYDPSIGRFLSRDPIHAGANDYAYCDNNPVTAVDPSGEQPFSDGTGLAVSGMDGRGSDAGTYKESEASQKAGFDVGGLVDDWGANGYIAQAGQGQAIPTRVMAAT